MAIYLRNACIREEFEIWKTDVIDNFLDNMQYSR